MGQTRIRQFHRIRATGCRHEANKKSFVPNSRQISTLRLVPRHKAPAAYKRGLKALIR
jgi:hypothetical protein